MEPLSKPAEKGSTEVMIIAFLSNFFGMKTFGCLRTKNRRYHNLSVWKILNNMMTSKAIDVR